MSLPKRMDKRNREDRELERVLGIRKHDPVRERYGGIRYSTQDIEALTEEKVPWLRRRRRGYPR